MRTGKYLGICAAAAAVIATSALSQNGRGADAVRYLAGTCANCHGTTGQSAGGMPSLAGLERAYMVDQMKQFRDGKRPATIMHQLAKGYSDQDIDALAEHFARQPRAK